MPPVPPPEVPHWLEYVKAFLQPTAILIVAYLTYMLGYKNWLRQKRKEVRIGIDVERFKARLESSKAVWALLEYLSTEKEHPKSVFVKRGTKDKSYFVMRRAEAELFLAAIPTVLFEKGHGIALSPQIETQLFEARKVVRRIIDASRNVEAENGEVLLDNIKGVHDIDAIREKLRESLLEIINAEYVTE